MRKIFMAMAVVLLSAAVCTSCKKKSNDSEPTQKEETLIDKLCNMYGSTPENAVQMAKNMGFVDVVFDSIYDIYRCQVDSVTQKLIEIQLDTAQNIDYITYADHTTTGNKAAELATKHVKEVGETRTMSNFTCKFEVGVCDNGDKEIKAYGDFVTALANLQEDMYAVWSVDEKSDRGIMFATTYYETANLTGITFMVGQIGG